MLRVSLTLFNLQGTRPVSYTHLDVYKRQVYGAAADGKGNRGDPAPLSVVSSAEKERLQEAPFRALWGRSIFVLG